MSLWEMRRSNGYNAWRRHRVFQRDRFGVIVDWNAQALREIPVGYCWLEAMGGMEPVAAGEATGQ